MNRKTSTTNSMTGFARYHHQDKFGLYIWEVKTLNHRFCDISLNIPHSIKGLELAIRKKINTKIWTFETIDPLFGLILLKYGKNDKLHCKFSKSRDD